MREPGRVLDLFCKAGGAAMGLHLAWPKAIIVGVDIEWQPNYCGHEFVQADAMTYPLDGFDFVWGSPPCQHYSWSTKKHRNLGKVYPRLIEPTVARLVSSGLSFCVENVVGAKKAMGDCFTLCGSMFGLGVVRHRLFRTNFSVPVPEDTCRKHGHGAPGRWYRRCTVAGHGGDGPHYSIQVWKDAMQIDWMTRDELTQAVPPAYSRYIAEQFLRAG